MEKKTTSKMTITLLTLILVSTLSFQVSAWQSTTLEKLKLTVYPDGFVSVESEVKVDPTRPSVNLTLPGLTCSTCQSLLVEDMDGNSLDFEVLNGVVMVYTLGVEHIKVFYTTQNLTSKIGETWILSLNSTTPVTIILPENVLIVSLNKIPESIKMLDGKTVLLMSQGTVELTYTVNLKGTKEYAQTTILDAKEAISKAKTEGRTLGILEAEKKLREAEEAFTKTNYSKASKLAEEAKKLAEKAVKPKPQIQPPIFLTPTLIGVILTIVIVGALIGLMKKRGLKLKLIKKTCFGLKFPPHSILHDST